MAFTGCQFASGSSSKRWKFEDLNFPRNCLFPYSSTVFSEQGLLSVVAIPSQVWSSLSKEIRPGPLLWALERHVRIQAFKIML